MRRISNKKKALVIVAVAAVGMAGAGGAYAYWTTGGSTTGSATAGEAAQFVVAQTGTITGLTLDNTQTINFTVQNTQNFAQRLTNLTIVPGTPTGGTLNVGTPCAADDYEVTNIQIVKGDIAANSTRSGTATLRLINKADKNQDNCQKASVPLAITAS